MQMEGSGVLVDLRFVFRVRQGGFHSVSDEAEVAGFRAAPEPNKAPPYVCGITRSDRLY
jgi:hypothetical protein